MNARQRFVLIVAICAAFLLPALTHGQETGAVGWDPADIPPPAWEQGLGYGVGILYAYGYWRGTRWLVGKFRGSRHWSLMRLLAPVVMLCLSAACFAHPPEWLIASLLAATFPSFLPAWLLLGVFELQGWIWMLLSALLAWPVWYALLRFAEWRLDATCNISLKIA